MADWVITYKARPAAELERWAVITEVPGNVTRTQVLDALAVAKFWPAWQARMTPGSQLAVRKGRRHDDGTMIDLSWDALVPESVRLGLDLPGDLHAQLVLRARARNVSLAAYTRSILYGAVALNSDEPVSALEAGHA